MRRYRYVNEKGKDKVDAYLEELHLTDTSDEAVEEFISHVAFVLSFGTLKWVMEVVGWAR